MVIQLAAQPLNNASLYVGDLDPQVTEMDLVEVFRQIGPLVSVHLCRDRRCQSLRYGYINFFDFSDASRALVCLNHIELRGKPIRIMWCQRNAQRRKTGIGNLFVKNLRPSVTSARLQAIFCKFGTILSCKVAEENGKSKGFGFVQFDSEDSSKAAFNALHGSMLEGKKLYVSNFVKKSERTNTCKEPKFTNLLVKNLGENVTEDVLQEKFSECGKVCNVVIVKDAGGKSRGFGFVSFDSHEEAQKAIRTMNGAILGSEKLSVGKAPNDDEKKGLVKDVHKKRITQPKASNLYVKNLDASIDDRKLEEHFSAYGKVTSAKVMRHDNGMSKGFGFVSFSSTEEAKRALDALHGTLFQGWSLYVAIAQTKEERHKEMQSYYAQYPLQSLQYSSNSDILTPQFYPTYYNFAPIPDSNPASLGNSFQPIMYQPFGIIFGAAYPFTDQSYKIPM